MTEKDYYLKGKTGNRWLDDAWFTVLLDDSSLADACISLNDTYDLKDFLLRQRVRDAQKYVESLRQARVKLEQQNGIYVYAFPRLYDSVILMQNRTSRWYKHYPKPQNALEAGQSQLYKRFPMTPETKVDVLIFKGSAVCRDERFREDLGPATVASTIGIERMPPKEWESNPDYRFRYGLYLVEVVPNAQVYRLNANVVDELWNDAEAKAPPMHKFRDKKLVDPADVELLAEKALPKMIQRIYGAEPKS